MRKKLAVKSSIIGIASKLITILLSIITSRLFVKYIGIEIMGINGVFTNVIGFLQLAELGIGTAITYALYQPIIDNNIEEIKSLMHFYKIMYRVIFIVVAVLGVVMTPFLGFFLTDTTYDYSYIVLVFLIQVASTAVTYLLAYKRNLMYADQKQYIYTYIDAGVNLFCSILRVILIVVTKSYVIYLILAVVQNLVANIIVDIKCNKLYPYLLDKNIGKYDKTSELVNNLKNIVIGKIGGWVYSSTDNLVMSHFVGVVVVGMMTNYYTLRYAITEITGAIVAPIQPMIANYIRDEKTPAQSYKLFRAYTFIRYAIANIVTVGFIVMANPVVSLWIGKDYTLAIYIPVLLAADVFISITHGPTGEFIAALGLFQNDRDMSLIAMVINLIVSIALVYKIGVAGVLIGTVIAQAYYWIARARIVFKQYFEDGLMEYIIVIAKYIITTGITTAVLVYATRNMDFLGDNLVWLLGGIIGCVLISMVVLVATNFWTEEFKYSVSLVKRVIFRRKNDDEEAQ